MIFLILSLLTLLSQIDSNPTQQKKQRRETEPIPLQRIPFSNRALSDLDHILDSVGIDRNRVIYKVKSISDTGDVIKVVPARQGPHYPTNELRSKDQLTIFLSVPKSELSPFIEAYQREKEKSSGEIEARIEGKNILCPRDLLIPYISQETKEDTGTVNLSNLDIREYPLRKLNSILDSCKIFNRKLVVRKIMKKEDEIRVVSKNPYSPKDEMRRNETLTIYLLLPESKLGPFLEGYKNIPPEMQGSTKEIKAEVENETLYCPIKLLKPYLPKSSEERIEGYIGKFLFILLFLGGLVVLSRVAMLILLPKNLGSAISKAFWGEEKEKKKEEGEEREIKGLEGIQRQLGLLRDFVKVGAQKVGEKWEKFPQEIESVLSSKRDGIIKETTKQVLENESLLERIREMIKEEKRKEPPIEVTQIPLLEAYNRTLQSKDKTLQEEFIKSRDAVRVSPEGERAEKGYLAPKDADYLFRKDPNGTFLIIEERGDFFAFPDFNTDITTSSAVISAFNINVAELADSKNWGVISPAKAEKIEGGLWRLIKMGEIGRTQISPEERVIKKINEIEEKFTKEVEIIKNEIDLLEKRKEEIKEIPRDEIKKIIRKILDEEFSEEIKRMIQTEIPKKEKGVPRPLLEKWDKNLKEKDERLSKFEEEINSLKEKLDEISMEIKSISKETLKEDLEKFIRGQISSLEENLKKEILFFTEKTGEQLKGVSELRKGEEKTYFEVVMYNEYLGKTEKEQRDFLERNRVIEVKEGEVKNIYISQKNGPLILISSPSLNPDEYFIFPAFTTQPDSIVSTFNVSEKELKKWRIKEPGICRKVSENRWELVKRGEIVGL